jgi:hypothetical protein
VQIPKVQKKTEGFSVFLRFYDLRTEKLLVKCLWNKKIPEPLRCPFHKRRSSGLQRSLRSDCKIAHLSNIWIVVQKIWTVLLLKSHFFVIYNGLDFFELVTLTWRWRFETQSLELCLSFLHISQSPLVNYIIKDCFTCI